MGQEILLLCVIFFAIAFIYSSAGFGGGSSYLAVLTLFGIAFTELRLIALSCNIAVVISSSILFSKHLEIKWRRIWPLVVLSVPLAYLGGRFKLSQEIFQVILGFSLLLASIMMFFEGIKSSRQLPRFTNALFGGFIGFLSGLVGIGGGIFLSPVLHLSRWGKPKMIAATSAFFILVNSIAGMVGQISQNGFKVDLKLLIPLIFCVILGGQIGVRSTIMRFSSSTVKKLTSFVIFIVALRLIIIYFTD